MSSPLHPPLQASLPPHQAVQALQDRVKRIHRINTDVADWLQVACPPLDVKTDSAVPPQAIHTNASAVAQERRRVEEQYALGLRKLLHFRAPNAQTELG